MENEWKQLSYKKILIIWLIFFLTIEGLFQIFSINSFPDMPWIIRALHTYCGIFGIIGFMQSFNYLAWIAVAIFATGANVLIIFGTSVFALKGVPQSIIAGFLFIIIHGINALLGVTSISMYFAS